MIRRPPRSTQSRSSAASDVYKRQEINVPIKIAGVRIHPGDWAVGDDDGVIIIPKARAAEFANRAMDVLEKENRLRGEILRGSTLSQVAYLEKWEKRK